MIVQASVTSRSLECYATCVALLRDTKQRKKVRYKVSGRKINEVNKVSKLCFGAPEMFSASQNYLSLSDPPKSGRIDDFILQIRSLNAQVLYSK